jgi:hypothetical protein
MVRTTKPLPRLAKAAACLLFAAAPTVTLAQGTAQGVAQGVVGQGVTLFQQANESGPGFFYLGATGADRGLGYDGSFYTLGGFIPLVEDGWGGVWNVDTRNSLSDFGGYFSNLGAVRKQFVGGAVTGLGIYWDYDGDVNQFITSSQIARELGTVFNQVGVSGEVLTDWGNGRVNGYFPVGLTEFTQGTTNSPFFGHELLVVPGFYGALTGFDGEIGAYVPGLSDWAGMISVGGYSFGATNLPAFGGVFTRLDMTFARNWDFQIQANNDPFFDWTGFARLTYRMGGSRRRNVPDQMEQPMQRNMHIVRAAQDRVRAYNPRTLNPYYVVHVNNAVPGTGTGSAERPYNSTTLANADAQWASGRPDTIMFINRGNGTSNNYDGQIEVASYQQVLGGGVAHTILTQRGFRTFRSGAPGALPVITNTSVVPGADAAILLSGNAARVAGVRIDGATVGIRANDGVNLATLPSRIDQVQIANSTTGLEAVNVSGSLDVSNTSITGGNTAIRVFEDGTAPGELTGNLAFNDVTISEPTASAIVVGTGTAGSGGEGSVSFRGTIQQTDGSDRLIAIRNTTGGTVDIGGSTREFRPIRAVGGQGILVAGTAGDVDIADFQFEGSSGPGDTGVIEIADTVTGAGRAAIRNGLVRDGVGTAVHVVNAQAIAERMSIVDMRNKPGAGSDDTIRLGQGFYVQQNGSATVTTVRFTNNFVSNAFNTQGNAFLMEAPAGTLNATLNGNSVGSLAETAFSLRVDNSFATSLGRGVVYLDAGSLRPNSFGAGDGVELVNGNPTLVNPPGGDLVNFNIVQPTQAEFDQLNGGTVNYVPAAADFNFNSPGPIPQP